MSADNRFIDHVESHHGVLLNISGYGVLIIGQAGIGKSSVALDFLHQGHRLIADDCVDFKTNGTLSVIGHCPSMLAGLLHTRELGVISLTDIFNASAWQASIQLHYIIRLQENPISASALSVAAETYTVCEQSFPMLILDISSPATVYNRINTWLNMQTHYNTAAETLSQRQQIQMETHNDPQI